MSKYSSIFIRDNGGQYSDHRIEFIDSSGYDPDEALELIKRSCPGSGWVYGQMVKENFWQGELEPLHEAVCVFNFPEDLLKGISVDTVRKLAKEFEESYRADFTNRAAELTKTHHPKAAANLILHGENVILEMWIRFEQWRDKNAKQ
jgi:hypothetical protein